MENYISIHGTGEGKDSGSQKPPKLPATLTQQGLVSILIPCCGMLEYTKICVPSILRHSRDPYELIFLDIGSLDGTAEYLAALSAAAKVRVEVIRAATDLDIPAVCKEALLQARGEYLVLLNNDTVVTDAWLGQMLGLPTSTPTIGMVGPMSNYAAEPQLVRAVSYRVGPKRKLGTASNHRSTDTLVDASAVNEFAKKYREDHRGKWLQVERLGGFCALVRRQVLKKIEQFGSLDDWSNLGLFDTDILSVKARQAGFQLACCRDLFIHHFGTRVFAQGAPTTEPTQQQK